MKDTGYAPARGLPLLREAIAARTERLTGIPVDPETQVVVTNGAMQALHIIMTALLQPGDEVVIPSPCFSYDGLVKLARGTAVYVPMQAESEYAWDIDRIEAAIGASTKLLIVNTPTNPTGRVLSRSDLERLDQIADRYRILVVADEAYDRLVYDGRRHESIYGVAEASERTLLVQSATKSFAMGAWRVGWIVGPPTLATIFAKMIEWMMLAGCHVSQAAVAAAIDGPEDWLENLASEFQRNRDLSAASLKRIGGLPFVVPQGGPFLLPDVSALGISGDDFAKLLILEYGLRVSGGGYYNSPDCIRIPFGGAPNAIEETFRRLEMAVRRQQSRKSF